MKATISQRSVYYKTAEVEIDIPDTLRPSEVQEYILENGDLWSDQINQKMHDAEFEFGFGMESSSRWTDKEEPSEWRFEVKGFGGHL